MIRRSAYMFYLGGSEINFPSIDEILPVNMNQRKQQEEQFITRRV